MVAKTGENDSWVVKITIAFKCLSECLKQSLVKMKRVQTRDQWAVVIHNLCPKVLLIKQTLLGQAAILAVPPSPVAT